MEIELRLRNSIPGKRELTVFYKRSSTSHSVYSRSVRV